MNNLAIFLRLSLKLGIPFPMLPLVYCCIMQHEHRHSFQHRHINLYPFTRESNAVQTVEASNPGSVRRP